MSKLVPIGLGAAAVIAVLFLGSRSIGSPSSNVGGPASEPPASAAPSEAPASTAPASAAPSPVSPPPLTETFTSQMHGISMSYPEGGPLERRPSPGRTPPSFPPSPTPFSDDPVRPGLTDHLHLRFASQPIGDSTPEEWVAEQMAGVELPGNRADRRGRRHRTRSGPTTATRSPSRPPAAATGSRSGSNRRSRRHRPRTIGRGSRRSLPRSSSSPEDAVDVAPSATP